MIVLMPASVSAQEEGITEVDETEEFEISIPAMGIYKSEEPFYQIETLDYSQMAEVEEEMAEEDDDGNFFGAVGDAVTNTVMFVPNLFSDTAEDVQNNIKDSLLYTLNGIVGILMTIIQIEAELVLAIYNFTLDSNLMSYLLNQVEGTVQNVAGIDSTGNIMNDTGLFGNLFGLAISISLIFVAVLFVVKRAQVEALKAILSPIIVLTIAMVMISNMTSILTTTNEMTTTVMSEVTEIGKENFFNESGTEIETTEDILHHTMVYKPYMLMQYGTYDEDTVDPERSHELLTTTNTSDRQTIIENELTEHGNAMVSPGSIWVKVAYGSFALMVNLLISIPIILIAGLNLFLEFVILFIVFISPFAFLWALLPNQFPVLKRYLGMLFAPFLYKLLIAVFIMIMTTILAIVYSMSSSYGIVGYGVSGFIMLVVMIAMYLLKNKVMSIFTVTSEGQQMARMSNTGDGAVNSAVGGTKKTARAGTELALAYATGGTSALATRGAMAVASRNGGSDEDNASENRNLSKMNTGTNERREGKGNSENTNNLSGQNKTNQKNDVSSQKDNAHGNNESNKPIHSLGGAKASDSDESTETTESGELQDREGINRDDHAEDTETNNSAYTHELHNMKGDEAQSGNDDAENTPSREESDIQDREGINRDEPEDNENVSQGGQNELHDMKNADRFNNDNNAQESSSDMQDRDNINRDEPDNVNQKEPSSNKLENMKGSDRFNNDEPVNNKNQKEPSSATLDNLNNENSASNIDTESRKDNDVESNENYQNRVENREYKATKPETKSENLNDRDEASSRRGEDE